MAVQSFSSQTLSSHRAFELIAGHPVLDLINTLDWRFRDSGSEELLVSYGDLLSFCEQARLISPTEARRLLRSATSPAASRVLAELKQLREAAAVVFYAALEQRVPSAASVKALDAHIQETRKLQHLQWTTSRFGWQLPQSDANPSFPLWLLALSTESLLTSSDLLKVRACNNPGCRWLFLDTSKNHTRRWCDMKICGNRMKARRFKALHRA